MCQICNGKNHAALACPHRFNHAYQPDLLSPALAAMTLNDSSIMVLGSLILVLELT